MMEKADMSNLKFDGESRESASLSIPTNHPKYKEPEWKVYGPYQSKQDLRKRLVLYNGIERITISLARFIMECHLQRLLNEDEEVDHYNTLQFDDRIENLRVLKTNEHRKNHAKYTDDYFICPVCKQVFVMTAKQISERVRNLKRRPNMKGPYCSRSCNGKDNN